MEKVEIKPHTPTKEEAFNPLETIDADVKYSKDEIVQRIMYRGADGRRVTKFRKLYTEEDVESLLKEQREICAKEHYPIGNWKHINDKIKNAPSPNL